MRVWILPIVILLLLIRISILELRKVRPYLVYKQVVLDIHWPRGEHLWGRVLDIPIKLDKTLPVLMADKECTHFADYRRYEDGLVYLNLAGLRKGVEDETILYLCYEGKGKKE